VLVPVREQIQGWARIERAHERARVVRVARGGQSVRLVYRAHDPRKLPRHLGGASFGGAFLRRLEQHELRQRGRVRERLQARRREAGVPEVYEPAQTARAVEHRDASRRRVRVQRLADSRDAFFVPAAERLVRGRGSVVRARARVALRQRQTRASTLRERVDGRARRAQAPRPDVPRAGVVEGRARRRRGAPNVFIHGGARGARGGRDPPLDGRGARARPDARDLPDGPHIPTRLRVVRRRRADARATREGRRRRDDVTLAVAVAPRGVGRRVQRAFRPTGNPGGGTGPVQTAVPVRVVHVSPRGRGGGRRGPQAVRAPVMGILERPRRRRRQRGCGRPVPTVVPQALYLAPKQASRALRVLHRAPPCAPRGDRDEATTGGSRIPRHSAVLENRNGRPKTTYGYASEAPGSGLDALASHDEDDVYR